MRVALLVRDHPFYLARENRWCGLFSYPVPEFQWEHRIVARGEKIDLRKLADYDVVMVEDETVCSFRSSGPPVVFVTWDGTLSQDHYQQRRAQGAMSDLILVEHDALERYRCTGKPVRRLLFAVNDRVFRDRGLEKVVDVSFHCRLRHRLDRVQMDAFLSEFCAAAGLTYGGGVLEDLNAYAAALNQSRIVVNLSKSPFNRNFRFFDTMASRACLLTNPMPYVEGDPSVCPETHWAEYYSLTQLAGRITRLIRAGEWQGVADAGYALMKGYTWQARAQELRDILRQELGI